MFKILQRLIYQYIGRHPLCREDKWFFFTSRNRKYPNGARPGQVAGDGFWKPTGSSFEFKVNGVKVASRKKLDYYTGSYQKNQKTNWKMHEYVFEGYSPHNNGDNDGQLVCTIF